MGKLFGRRWNGKRNTLRRSNAGFSLVEMVVSLAIMGIVAGAVGTFMVTGNSSYMRGNSEVTLQEEAQLTANQLIDLIIDVEEGISFSAATDTADLVLLNEENAYLVRWKSATQEISLYEATVDSLKDADGKLDATASAIESVATGALLAEYVTSFNVDLTNLKTDRTVKLQMDFSFQSKTASIDESIRLRNELPDTPYDGKQQLNWITDIKISPNPAEVAQGGSIVFSYTMTGDEGAIAEGVTWSVTGARSNDTVISTGGLLSAGADEEIGKVFSVTVTSKADTSQSDTAKVTVIEKSGVDSLTIDPPTANVMQGDSQTFTYTITGTDAALKSPATWTVEPVDGSSVTLSSGTGFTENSYNTNYNATDPDNHSATLHVSGTQATGAKILKVTVTVLNKSATAYVTVLEKALEGAYDTRLILQTLTPYTYDDNGVTKIGYKADIECLTSKCDYTNGYPKITWRVVGSYDGDGYTKLPSSSSVSESNKDDGTPQYYCTLQCGTNYDKTVRVEADVEISKGKIVTVGVDVTIPKMTEGGYNSAVDDPYITSSNFQLDRNGSITLQLVNYNEETQGKVQWRFIEDYGLCDVSAAPADREIGFDYIAIGQNKGNLTWEDTTDWSKTWDSVAACQNLMKYGYGTETLVHAKYTIDYDQEYRLLVGAYNQESGELIASTIVFIPKFDIQFTNGEHYQTLDIWRVWDYRYYVTAYGFDAAGDHALLLTCELEQEVEKTTNSVIMHNTAGFAGNQYFGLYVTKKDYDNSYFIVKFYDTNQPDSARYLTIYYEPKYELLYDKQLAESTN